jgi:hypothetical protein
MAQYEIPKPIEERQNQRPVTFVDFLKETWTVPAAWLGGALAGMAFARARGIESGTPKYMTTVGVPAKIGAFVAFFMMWKKTEAERLGVEEIYTNYKDAKALRMDNEGLKKENALLKQMVEYEDQKDNAHAKSIIAAGPRTHHTHEAKSHAEHAMKEPAELTAAR